MEKFSLYNYTNINRNRVKQIKRNYQQQQQIKTIFWQIPSILLTTFICTAAIAQEYPGCFLVDRAGNKIDLTISLCRLSAEQLSGEVSTSTTPKGIYQIPIKSRRGGIPVIDVTFNGNQTYEMMLDTCLLYTSDAADD